MVESSKQVRVDNWGIFFLQRLQMFFSKTDYCDLTLQFEGNVQLKVHRLVMNACTEYFTFLEESCSTMEENTIMMPADLQADVIVPIVNFMYTGMLEFHMSLFEKLYKAAELMNITVLTKLLDAQKVPLLSFKTPRKKTDAASTWNKKTAHKTSNASELPATLPGRKLPVWKRKSVPTTTPMQHPSSQLHFTEQKWAQDPLLVPDNAPKPTRFEWPEDDLPALNLMDTSFEEISYTSKPLLTREEESRASTSFDEIRNNVNNLPKKPGGKTSEGSINMKEVEDYVKEQKIRTDLSTFEEGDEYNEIGQKRKTDKNNSKLLPKKRKLNDKENKEATISITGNNGTELDHTKIVSEILKKYPQLVGKNKNIRLKIMASGKNISEQKVTSTVKSPQLLQVDAASKPKGIKQAQKPQPEKRHTGDEGPWSCKKCAEAGELSQEFVLYYLYRKHMSDVHNEVFDFRLCKYCGRKCGKHNLMMYHMYTKHGLKPPSSYNFPKCDQCPYIALSVSRLNQHKLRHDPNEMQCVGCKLAFTSQQTLTAHIQITGHFSKAGKSSYDCQYCTKKLQSAINLFSHIKNSHLKEGKRDGIVSLDEMDDVDEVEEDAEDEEAEEDEYIVPEILPDLAMQKDKVKIISNVKVPVRSDQGETQETVTLEPSSEAEALNNVATGIATSLGLVDIVVLDDNQQYILQQQENQSGESEFILPELTPTENPFRGQVITTQHSSVLQQGVLQSSGSAISSTDELVMVLTDHDYQDDQEGETTDNSNIVVLYSHPVDGQQGQFITSQGNLLVNSQTGMLEIRNGTTISTAANHSPEETPIESIELIQKEIDSHTELKQEPIYEEENDPNVTQIPPVEEPNLHPEESLIHNEAITEKGNNENGKNEEENGSSDQKGSENQQEEPSEHLEENVGDSEEVGEESTLESSTTSTLEQESESKTHVEDNVDGAAVALEEPMEVDEVMEEEPQEDEPNKEELAVKESPVQETLPTHHESEQDQTITQETITSDKEGVDVPPDHAITSEPTPEYEISGNFSSASALEESSIDEVADKNDTADHISEQMEVDGVTEQQQREETSEDTRTLEHRDFETQESGEKEVADQTEICDEKEEAKKIENDDGNVALEQQIQEEASELASEYQHQSETSNSQYNDEDDNSQSSQETSQNSQNNENRSNINQTILDDWEDTDSQQSEKQRAAMKQAAENVNKLMDDWEEEDEEDRRERD